MRTARRFILALVATAILVGCAPAPAPGPSPCSIRRVYIKIEDGIVVDSIDRLHQPMPAGYERSVEYSCSA